MTRLAPWRSEPCVLSVSERHVVRQGLVIVSTFQSSLPARGSDKYLEHPWALKNPLS